MSQCYIRRRQVKQSYTPVDYIKFGGTVDSVFNTDITLGNKCVSITFDMDGSSSSNGGGVFGVNGSSSKNYIQLYYSGNDKYFTSTGSTRTSFTIQDSGYGKHTFVNNINGKNTFDGEEVTSYSTQTLSTYTYRFGMYAGTSNIYFGGKIYEIKITDNTNDEVLLWCTPVSYVEGGTTKYGFYDSVSNTLITRTGWTGGNDVVELVSWSKGTPAQIAAMLQAHDDGLINITDYWNIGDERTVNLGAISAGTVLPAMAAQTVKTVLMNEGYNSQSGIHYVVGLKDCLSDASAENTSNTNAGSWGSSAIRADLNSVYYNAFPANEKALYKQFNTVTISENDSTTLQTVQDYFALPAEKEIFGEVSYCVTQEAAALTQIDYYKTTANRIKKRAGSDCPWWERSPWSSNRNGFCLAYSNGNAYIGNAGTVYGIAPFGCI